jgi:hypothetical protein
MEEDDCSALPSFQVSFPGPFNHHDVAFRGRRVPFLRAQPLDGGKVHLQLDRRFGLDLTAEEAERFVPFLAHSIAVAMGYAAHPREALDEPKRLPPFPRMVPLALPTD